MAKGTCFLRWLRWSGRQSDTERYSVALLTARFADVALVVPVVCIVECPFFALEAVQETQGGEAKGAVNVWHDYNEEGREEEAEVHMVQPRP